MTTRKILNRILSKEILPLDVASMMLKALCHDEELVEHIQSRKFQITDGGPLKATFLLKVAVILPEPAGLDEPEALPEGSM